MKILGRGGGKEGGGSELLRLILLMVTLILVWVLSAIAHESDMYDNLRKYGDAKAWTCKIISNVMKQEN